jgi:Na+/proline symporter
MSNLSAALNSLSSSTVVDLFKSANEERQIRFSRVSTFVWAVVLFGIALLTAFGGQRVLELGLSIASIPYGGLLGVFLLGTLTKRLSEFAAMVGMVAGVCCNLLLWMAPRLHWVAPDRAIAWTWYVAIGTMVTVAVAVATSMMRGNGASTGYAARY